MATVGERVSVVETKVEALSEKLDDVKKEVTNNHAEIKEQLKTMASASSTQHAELGRKLGDLEKFRDKWVYLVMGAFVVLSWAAGHLDKLIGYLK